MEKMKVFLLDSVEKKSFSEQNTEETEVFLEILKQYSSPCAISNSARPCRFSGFRNHLKKKQHVVPLAHLQDHVMSAGETAFNRHPAFAEQFLNSGFFHIHTKA